MCVCVCVMHLAKCQVISCPYLFFSMLVAACCLLWQLKVFGGSGVKKAAERAGMLVSVSAFTRGGFCGCMYSKHMFVCPVILGINAMEVYF